MHSGRMADFLTKQIDSPKTNRRIDSNRESECSTANLRKIPPGGGRLYMSATIVEPVPFVRDLGIMIDFELLMREHVSRTAQVCFC